MTVDTGDEPREFIDLMRYAGPQNREYVRCATLGKKGEWADLVGNLKVAGHDVEPGRRFSVYRAER